MPLVRSLAFSAALLVIAAAASAQNVVIEKFTNGQDADTAPGPFLIVGASVAWTYEVTNTSGRDLVNVVVIDDQGVVVSCPSTTVPAGTTMVCTATGIVVAGQYTNLGTVTAELTNGTPVSDSDPSNYFGQLAPSITIEKSTNGVDADVAPGPILAVGEPVSWSYQLTNVGADPLNTIVVTDDQGVVVSCPGTTLNAGESMTCTASGTAQVGQYANIGSVTAIGGSGAVGDSDPSHYFGQTIRIEKATNGQDADTVPGPVLLIGTPVNWSYVVTNPGPATVSNLEVIDDQGVLVTCPGNSLTAGASMTCTASGTAAPGQYANIGSVTGRLPLGGEVSDTDPSHYLGQVLVLEKSTNGQAADLPPGPVLAIGDAVAWTYEVTNLGADQVTNVDVSDDQGVIVTCPGTTIAAGASMTCTAAGTAVAGQYTNIGTVTADHPALGPVGASDPSHYFGQDQVLDFGDDADPPFPTLLASNGARHILGSGVFLGACVDSELDALQSAAADGDDANTGIATFGTCATAGDDEDGVTFTAPLVPGTTVGVDVVANAPCTLSAWIDFNADGDWFDAGEDIFPGGTALAAGVNSLTFPVSLVAPLGSTRARFRCTTDGAVTAVGQASDGEVEDYSVIIVGNPTISATKTASLAVDLNTIGVADGGDTLLYSVTITNSGLGPATGVIFTDTPDANTVLVTASVTTTQGTVTLGNTAGDTAVSVNVGDVAPAGPVTITYQAVIADPFPPGVPGVTNQGLVAGTNFPDVPTDDPLAGGSADPTVVSVAAASTPVPVPAASGWALTMLAFLLAGIAVRRLVA